MSEKKSKDKIIYFAHVGFINGASDVLKFKIVDGKLEHEVTYRVVNTGSCTCDAGAHHRVCKHVDMVIGDIHGESVSLLEARGEIAQLGIWLHKYYVFVDLPPEGPYKFVDGKIASARIIVTGVDRRIPCPFHDNRVYSVLMPDTRFKILVSVEALTTPRDSTPPPLY